MSEQTQVQILQTAITAEVPPNAELIEIKKMVSEIIEKINSIGSEVVAFTQHVNTIKTLSIILGSIGIWRCSSCKMNVNGVCTGWRLPEDLSNSLKHLLSDDAVIQQENIYRLRIDRLSFIGAICPIYIQR